ncbi:DUF4338 domain-containing protein [Candidatus Fermentibacteria bacterium]|nr:DUF4338 domain-containing protein [Candidatus Fermentibacteria bacterium]
MEELLRYRGKAVTREDVEFIKGLIARSPTASRRALSKLLCEAWDWRQPNGVLRDMVCRGYMLALHRKGFIELPPIRRRNPNPLAHRKRPSPHVLIDQTPIEGNLASVKPLDFRQVRRTSDEGLFGSLIECFHYLRYVQPVGEHLKYIIYSQDRPLACMAWSSAPRHLGIRDRFIGWSPEARRRNIRFIAYNTRFLILPWVSVRYLASHILGCMASMLPRDWEQVYGHPVYYLETFTDPARYRGTCYRAANWLVLGETSGRGNNAPTYEKRVPIKLILGYPLTRRFRKVLSGGVN